VWLERPPFLPSSRRGDVSVCVFVFLCYESAKLDVPLACTPVDFKLYIAHLILCPPALRGVHGHGVEWDRIKANFLPHRPTKALMHRSSRATSFVASLSNVTCNLLPCSCRACLRRVRHFYWYILFCCFPVSTNDFSVRVNRMVIHVGTTASIARGRRRRY